LNNYVTGSYSEGTNTVVKNSATGQDVNRSAAEVYKDYRMTDKERGYTRQWYAVMRAGQNATTEDEFNNNLGVVENYEPFVSDSKEYKKLLDDMANGAITPYDISSAAFKQLYGEDRFTFNAQQRKTGQEIEKLDYYIDALQGEYASEEDIGAIASMLNIDKSQVRNPANRNWIVRDLYGQSSQAKLGVTSQYGQLLTSMFGMSYMDARKMVESHIDDTGKLNLTESQQTALKKELSAFGLDFIQTDQGLTAVWDPNNSAYYQQMQQEAANNPYLSIDPRTWSLTWKNAGMYDATGLGSMTVAERQQAGSQYVQQATQASDTLRLLDWMRNMTG